MMKIIEMNDANIIVVIASIHIDRRVNKLPTKNKYNKRLKIRRLRSPMVIGIDIIDKYIKIEKRQIVKASITETTKFPNTS